MTTKLSEKLRPNEGVAQWMIEEIRRLENKAEVIDELRARFAELEAQIAAQERVVHGALAARAVVHYIKDLMGESRGIYGFHLNGDPCPWDYFDDLRSLIDDAIAAELPTSSGEGFSG